MLKKRKTYEISVIDKTYSKIISDETKFYTSDTSLDLIFKLKETEYTFESAEIALLNIDDRSLVTRPVVKKMDSFSYELDDDITAHYGEWHGQLRFEQVGETYVSSPVKFRIENDLSNERPPQLSDVQSWVSLKRYADKLTEELKQAVLSVDGVEDTFNENETERQNQFETAEQSRQTTFESNESERIETFNNNEDIRQAQELEREGAEGKRQTVFDDNEASRTETFNTNEATRQENEEVRELAENERENAEAQRKIDHENRSAELDSKADKIVLKNLTSPPTQVPYAKDFEGNTSDVWYASIEARYIQYNSGRTRLTLRNYGNSNNPTVVEFKSQVSENFEYYSLQASGKINGTRLLMSSDLSPDLEIEVRNLIVLNLTETFGAGNEPNKEEIDELIKVIGYIDGEYALDNKEMLIWTLALVRRNKNAIITLGGTI